MYSIDYMGLCGIRSIESGHEMQTQEARAQRRQLADLEITGYNVWIRKYLLYKDINRAERKVAVMLHNRYCTFLSAG